MSIRPREGENRLHGARKSLVAVDGRSGVVSVTTKARELRLFRGGALIETRALDLLPGDVNRVEL